MVIMSAPRAEKVNERVAWIFLFIVGIGVIFFALSAALGSETSTEVFPNPIEFAGRVM